MAKKPVQKGPSQEPKLKSIVRRYIQYEGDLKNEIFDPKLEFGFVFTHPKGSHPNGKPRGIGFQVLKPKKERFIEIGSKISISPEHIKILDADKKKKTKFFDTILKIFLMKNATYTINYKENFWIILHRIYLNDKKTISINLFFESIRNLLNSNVYAIRTINTICSGDLPDFNEKEDLSLYT